MKKLGRSTVLLENKPSIIGYAAVVGKKEGEGPLRNEFDEIYNDEYIGQKTFEKAESQLQTNAVNIALQKAGLTSKDADLIFAGDLLNQCIGSSFGLKDMNIPFVGLYGACSTMALSLSLASFFVDAGFADRAVAVTSSHFCSAERQYRLPLEYGGQRTPTAQWTVTGSGSAIVASQGEKMPYVNALCIGKIVDLGVNDANNMGAAMAPAAYDTICRFFEDTNTAPEDYDCVFTGDLGVVGSELLHELARMDGLDLEPRHKDCGVMIFDIKGQDVHGGGSGCGCSASVLCSHILNRMRKGEMKNILFVATGALMSPTSSEQGQTIPSIAHAVNIRID